MVQNAGLGVGALLKGRREELGQDRESVSKQLRIRSIYIRAIEEGRMQDLPGATYAVGFVRTYADFLGFDGNVVVDNYREEIGQRGRPEPLAWQMEDKDGGFPFGKLLIVLLVVAAAGYGLWYYLANTQSGTNLIEAVPEYLKKNTGTENAPATTAPASGTTTTGATTPAGSNGGTSQAAPAGDAARSGAVAGAQATTGQTAAPGTSEPAMPSAAPDAATAPAATTPGAMTQPTAPAGTATPPSSQGQAAPAGAAPVSPILPSATATGQATAGQPAGAQAAAVAQAGGEASPDVTAAATTSTTRITVKAKLESWVQINDKDGKPVISKVLRAGETYAVPDQKGLVMDTGNAGGIEVTVDGKAMPSLGSVGLVKRNIVLDPDKLATGEATAKAPAKSEPADGATPPTGD